MALCLEGFGQRWWRQQPHGRLCWHWAFLVGCWLSRPRQPLWSRSIMPPWPASRPWTGCSQIGARSTVRRSTLISWSATARVSPPGTGSTGEWGFLGMPAGVWAGRPPPSQLVGHRQHRHQGRAPREEQQARRTSLPCWFFKKRKKKTHTSWKTC